MKRLLLIEDDERMIESFGRILPYFGFDVTYARTLKEARKAFDEGEYDIIAVDGSLHSSTVNTLDLVRYIRVNFNGPMVAISTVADSNKQLVEAGCDHSCLKSGFAIYARKEFGS